MVLFPKDGKVIPHGRTMQMAKKGQVKMPENRESGGIIEGAKKAFMRTPFGEFFPSKEEQDEREAQRNLNPPPLGEIWDYIPENIRERVKRRFMGTPAQKFLFPEMGKRLPAKESDWYAADAAEKEAIDNAIQEEVAKETAIQNAQEAIADVPPASPEEMEALAKEQSTPPPVAPAPMPVMKQTGWSKGEQPALIGEAMKPSPQVQKPTSIYTPEEEALLAQGANMTARGLSEMGPRGVKFATGGGIDETGKAFGPNVVSQPQKPVTIRPGKVKDEQGDVGTRLAKEKENREFMKRWENDLNKEGGKTKSFA